MPMPIIISSFSCFSSESAFFEGHYVRPKCSLNKKYNGLANRFNPIIHDINLNCFKLTIVAPYPIE
jgi:hypothetical protein